MFHGTRPTERLSRPVARRSPEGAPGGSTARPKRHTWHTCPAQPCGFRSTMRFRMGPPGFDLPAQRAFFASGVAPGVAPYERLRSCQPTETVDFARSSPRTCVYVSAVTERERCPTHAPISAHETPWRCHRSGGGAGRAGWGGPLKADLTIRVKPQPSAARVRADRARSAGGGGRTRPGREPDRSPRSGGRRSASRVRDRRRARGSEGRGRRVGEDGQQPHRAPVPMGANARAPRVREPPTAETPMGHQRPRQ